MFCFTRERITREQVEVSKVGAQHFDLTVNPGDVDNPFCLSFLSGHNPRINQRYNVLEEQDILVIAKIMQRCLWSNPKDRAMKGTR